MEVKEIKHFQAKKLINILKEKFSDFINNNPLEYQSYIDQNVSFPMSRHREINIYALSPNSKWICIIAIWCTEEKLGLQICKYIFSDFIVKITTDGKTDISCSNYEIPMHTDYFDNSIYYLNLAKKILLDIFDIEISIDGKTNHIFNIEFHNIDVSDVTKHKCSCF